MSIKNIDKCLQNKKMKSKYNLFVNGLFANPA